MGTIWLTSIFQNACDERKVPDDWQRAVIVRIWNKNGSKRDCGMYRGISILSHLGIMYYQSPGTTSKVQSRTIPKRCVDRFQKRKGLHRHNFCQIVYFEMRRLISLLYICMFQYIVLMTKPAITVQYMYSNISWRCCVWFTSTNTPFF